MEFGKARALSEQKADADARAGINSTDKSSQAIANVSGGRGNKQDEHYRRYLRSLYGATETSSSDQEQQEQPPPPPQQQQQLQQQDAIAMPEHHVRFLLGDFTERQPETISTRPLPITAVAAAAAAATTTTTTAAGAAPEDTSLVVLQDANMIVPVDAQDQHASDENSEPTTTTSPNICLWRGYCSAN